MSKGDEVQQKLAPAQLKAEIARLREDLRPYGVVDLEWRISEDWAGDPALYLWLIVDGKAWEAQGKQGRARADRLAWERLMQAVGRDMLVYVRVRATDEEPAEASLEHLE